MDRQIYIPIIAALVGIVIGALAKELGVMFQGYREDKRVLKRVLYNQLDIWFEIKRADIGPLIPIYLQKLSETLQSLGIPAETIAQLRETDFSPLFAIARSLRMGEPEKLFERYQNSINDMASVDPILAYRISGRPEYEHLQERLEAFVRKVEEVAVQETADVQQSNFINFLKSQYHERIFQQTLDAMEKDILRVSTKIHLWTRHRAAQQIKRLKLMREQEIETETQKLVETFLAFANKSAATQ
jgi:hypothetical protein